MSRNKYPEQTREQILDTATRLFLQQGYEHTTIQNIIDQLGQRRGVPPFFLQGSDLKRRCRPHF